MKSSESYNEPKMHVAQETEALLFDPTPLATDPPYWGESRSVTRRLWGS